MDTVDTLAAGIAHEFNNILWIISGNTELAAANIPKGNPAHFNLECVGDACLRAEMLVRQMLTFSSRVEQEWELIDIGSVVKNAIDKLRPSVPSNIEIREDYLTEPCSVLADSKQINRVIINICANAVDAMRKEGGVLDVSVLDVDANEDRQHLISAHERHVRLRAHDTGDGIAPEIMDRIFDPYFTTKQVGKGTGMGLAVAHGIVKSHCGTITVQSELKKGTEFNVFFPVCRQIPLP